MEKLLLKCAAKLNLTLEVASKRADGYHELGTIMHSVGVYDTVGVEKLPEKRVIVDCSEPLPENNTAKRAAESFIAAKGCGGAKIRIEKGIPSEAGLGGASADAAAVFHALSLLYGKLPENALFELGASVGADVPFCLLGGCAFASGIGERLSPLPPLALPVLIVKQARGVSTAALFASLDKSALLENGFVETKKLRLAIESGSADAKAVAPLIMNSLSAPAEVFAPEIALLRKRLLDAGALGAVMTGSGSAVFGIFSSLDEAKRADSAFSDCAFAAAAETVDAPFKIVSSL